MAEIVKNGLLDALGLTQISIAPRSESSYGCVEVTLKTARRECPCGAVVNRCSIEPYRYWRGRDEPFTDDNFRVAVEITKTCAEGHVFGPWRFDVDDMESLGS